MTTEIIPLFPLSNVVLFPQVHCPLHIFEARYQQMAAAALGGSRRIGMTTVRPEHQSAMAGDPPLFEVGCIVEELPSDSERLYRLARVELLDESFDEAREGIPLQGLRADAIELLTQLLHFVAPDAAHEIDPRRFSGVDDTAFVSALCQMLELPPAEKQGLLEADGPMARCERLVVVLQFRLAELLGGMPRPLGALH